LPEICIVSTENCHDKMFKASLADLRDAAMELPPAALVNPTS
jgi:hypothetical protein